MEATSIAKGLKVKWAGQVYEVTQVVMDAKGKTPKALNLRHPDSGRRVLNVDPAQVEAVPAERAAS